MSFCSRCLAIYHSKRRQWQWHADFLLGSFGTWESLQGTFTPSILARAQTRARPGSVRLLLRYKAARVPMMPQFPFTFFFTLSGGPSSINLACLFKFSSCLLALESYDLEKTELLHFTPCALIVVRTFFGKTIVASFVWVSAPTSALLFYSPEHLLLSRKQHRTPNPPRK